MNIKLIKELSVSRSEMIKKLPEDILKKIYLEHFQVVIEYERVMKCYTNNKSYSKCDHIMIRHMSRILNNPKLLQYFIKHNSFFATIYYENIEPNIKYYENISDIIKSHTMSWLIRSYH